MTSVSDWSSPISLQQAVHLQNQVHNKKITWAVGRNHKYFRISL